MFDSIAPTYDRLNRIISLGLDTAWRRRVINLALAGNPGTLLDIGTGTGDLLEMARRRAPAVFALGIDFSFPMLAAGSQRAHGAGAHLAQADALSLPFADGAVDAMVSAFVVRNLSDRSSAFHEWRRVLTSGGRLVILEMTPMARGPLATLFRLHFAGLAPLVGRLISRHPFAYRYLPASVERFPDPSALAAELRNAGFTRIEWHRLGMGSVAIHVAEKPAAD